MKIITVIIFLFYSFNAFANEFDDIQNKFRNLLNDKDYEKALLLKDQYLNLANEKFNNNTINFAFVLNDISILYKSLGEYLEAIDYQKKILSIYKNTDDQHNIAKVLNNICSINNYLGRYQISNDNCDESITILKKLYGGNSEHLIEPLINKAVALQNKGKYFDSIKSLENALSIELNNNKRKYSIASLYFNLGLNFAYLTEHEDAIKYYLKAINIREEIYGENSLEISSILNSLGMSHALLGDFALAEETLLRGLEIRKNNLGENHHMTLRSKMNLALFYSDIGREKFSIKEYEEILAILINKYGLYHFEVYKIYIGLSHSYHDIFNEELYDYKKAEEYALQALEIGKVILDPLDEFISLNYLILSRLYFDKNEYKLSQEYSLKSANLERERNLQNYRLADEFDIEIYSDHTFEHIANFTALKSINHKDFIDTTFEDSFNLLLSISDIQASKALKKSSIRIIENDDELNNVIKNIQDFELRKKEIRQKILNNFLNSENINITNQINQKLEDELILITKKIDDLNIYINEKFPNYFNLIQPHSSSIKEIQELLISNESILSYFIDKKSNMIFLVIISNDIFDIKLIDYNYDELEKDINTIRSSLDAITLKDFDFKLANKIYKRLIQPIESYIQDKEQLLIIPDKVLFKIPFSLLVRHEYEGEYKKAPWLINDYSIVNLPSINSLKYLHSKTISQSETLSYVGFGDPVLSNYANNSYRGIFDNIDDIKKLESLPETKEELLKISEILGKDNGKIYLGESATETNFKQLDFKSINLLLFATHGLISGELIGLEEPGLVMTPPPEASLLDNGILTASEILSFNFPSLDLVILSACNTSAGTSKNPEELSGLTRSFFYAGANSLLVSHWPVESDSAVQLTTNMFKYIQNNKISKGYALQKSMKDFISNAEKDYQAHPIFWAPFMLVGGN